MAAANNKSKTSREELNTRKRSKACEEYHLPRNVLEAILSKLPLKSIRAFKAVSKAWKDLIIDPGFGRVHARRNKDYNDSLFMWHSYLENKYRIGKFDGDGMFDIVVPDLRFPLEGVCSFSCSIKASCDGFFLLYDGGKSYVLWNPITGANTSFPSWTVKWAVSAHGICHDPRWDDYKVVCVTNKNWYSVYFCRDGCWSEGKEFPYCIGSERSEQRGVTVGGVSYWIFAADNEKASEIIVYFEVAECGFRTLKIRPDELVGADDDDDAVVHLTSLNGRLCLYQQTRGSCNEMKIWVLMHENNSDINSAYWTKLADVVNLPRSLMGESYCDVKPMYLMEDRRRVVLQVFLSRGERCFIVYDIMIRTCIRLWTFGDRRHLEIVVGLGSLVLPAHS